MSDSRRTRVQDALCKQGVEVREHGAGASDRREFLCRDQMEDMPAGCGVWLLLTGELLSSPPHRRRARGPCGSRCDQQLLRLQHGRMRGAGCTAPH